MKPIALLLIVGMFASLAGAQTATPPPVPPATPPPAKPAVAGTPAPAAPGAAAAAPANPNTPPDKPPLTPAELEQLLATIALYPDSLLTQILMASTYPLEIVQADRWAKENKSLTGDALATALEKQPWDPSVKSLINFPQVLAMMNDKLDLTIKMGDAFIEQQSDVMNTIQKLRAKANATGNLKSNEQQKVIIEQAPPATQQTTVVVEQAPPQVPPQPQVIVIQPAQPNVIYVPTYSPTVVYGVWAYPAYPPYPYYPPNYVASNVVAFGAGVAVGAAWGYAWGNSNWNSGDVDINVNRNTNINNKIDRSKYQQNINNRQNNRQANGAGANRGSWQHDPSHRQGVPYRDNKTASQYGRGNGQAAQARDQYRGRADAGRQDLNRGGASDFRGTGGDFSGGAGNRGGAGAGAAGAGNRGNAGAGGAGGAGANRPSATPSYRGNSSPSSGSRGSAMNGVGGGGSSARQSSQRGQASRSSSGYSGGGGSRGGGGGSRGGGGGSRGGGGGRGRSDVNLKSDFASVDPNTVLEKVANLPITTWNYKDDPESRHLGPMAQDFYRAFGIGSDDKTITFLDEGGVALSAIQGLNQKLDERDARIKALEREVAELKALVQKLADKPSAGAASKN